MDTCCPQRTGNLDRGWITMSGHGGHDEKSVQSQKNKVMVWQVGRMHFSTTQEQTSELLRDMNQQEQSVQEGAGQRPEARRDEAGQGRWCDGTEAAWAPTPSFCALGSEDVTSSIAVLGQL